MVKYFLEAQILLKEKLKENKDKSKKNYLKIIACSGSWKVVIFNNFRY